MASAALAQRMWMPAEPSLEDRLNNWGSWARRQMLIYEQCESLEGNYRSPQPWYLAPVNPPLKPEDRDAYEIALAAASLKFQDHFTLKLGYVVGLEDYRVAKILSRELRRTVLQIDMPEIYYQAKENLKAALKMGAVLRRERTVDRIRRLLPRLVDPMED